MRMYSQVLRLYGVELKGRPRYISTTAKFDDFDQIVLGDRTVVSANVIFLTHDYSLTTALIACGRNLPSDIAFIKKICVGNNVFIGMNAVLLPGTTIGDNVLIGAGTVVRGRVESNSVMVGNPAVKIGTLMDLGAKWSERKIDGSIVVDAP
jgi:acetyltransferase-like isoleucine patch superfamily enzyme